MGNLIKGIAKLLKKVLRNESGQAIVEFALVLPLLLALLMGILDFGWIFMNQYNVEKAASAAARYGTINVDQYKDSSTKQEYLNGLKTKAADNLPDGGESILCVDGSTSAQDSDGITVVSVDVGRSSVSVTVTYPVRTLTFVAGALYGMYYPATSTSVSSY